jgi:hypothetical protein
MHLIIDSGTTSKVIPVPIRDSSSATGALLGGLTSGSSGLTAYYDIEGASGGAVAISLTTMTKGTWVSGGFIPTDGTNMSGVYLLGVPNAVLAGADGTWATIVLRGATNMVDTVITIELSVVAKSELATVENIATAIFSAIVHGTASFLAWCQSVGNDLVNPPAGW